MAEMIKYIGLALLMAVFPLQGCATMDKEECLTADWRQIGFEDGLKGYAPDRVAQHRKACAEHGITPDVPAYTQGRVTGLAQYCTPAKGFSLGHSGHPYSDVCSLLPDQETAFHQGFLTGRDIFLLEKEISDRETSVRRLQKELSSLEARLREKERELNQNCSKTGSCQAALNLIRDLDREIRITEDQIRRERRVIAALSNTLRDQKAASPY